MGFLHPELLLFILPAAVVWWFARESDVRTRAVRLLLLLLLILAIAGLFVRAGSSGRDLILVADRSRSMPGDSVKSIREMIRLAEAGRGPGDRIGIVSVGGTAEMEQMPAGNIIFNNFERSVDSDASDIASGLEAALQMIPPDRNGSILLISDGEFNGRDPIAVARRAGARGVPIYTRALLRPELPDLAIDRVDLPDSIAANEPFQFVTWVRSDARREADFTLERDGVQLVSGKRVFEAGMNRVVFRDSVDRAGISRYVVQLSDSNDRVPENNRAIAALRVEGARPILIINDNGAPDTLSAAIQKAQFPVIVTSPEKITLDPVTLASCRAVVLENVAAGRLRPGLDGIRSFVEDHGGGLWITGGNASFGVGGYYNSVLDATIPVTMELREEHRKFGVAIAIALDRSGSMAMAAGGGLLKMDLANLGTCAAVELLSPMDSVSVIAVDSAPHVLVELTPAVDIANITKTVRTIRSMGGGIFCYQALVSAGRQLENASQVNRHIILFADAADAEEPGQYKSLLEEYRQANITVSVIGLGQATDQDAEFLKDIAKRGGGEIYFTTDPKDLPRVFTQDTMNVARSSFIDQKTPARPHADLYTLGEITEKSFPDVGGYNLTYLRPGASLGVVTEDEYKAPILAFMHHGLGRSAALTAQIGGRHGGDWIGWPGFSPFVVTIARWLAGQEEPREIFTSVHREGKDAVLRVEVDPAAASTAVAPDTSQLSARISDSSGITRNVILERVDMNTFEARYSLTKEGVSIGTVKLDDRRSVALPPITLPYSPEFEPVESGRGARCMLQLSEESGGVAEPPMSAVFEGERGGRSWQLLTNELLAAAMVILMIEIAGRRIGYPAWTAARIRLPRFSRRAVAPAKPSAAPARAQRVSSPAAAAPPAPAPPPAAPPSALGDALARARESAGREIEKK